MYSVCSFRYMLANSFCAFFKFLSIVISWVPLFAFGSDFYVCTHFLTANHGTLSLALCLVGMHSAAAFKWTLTKFSYSSFGVGIFDISWSTSNLFLSVNVYLSLIFLLLCRDQSWGTVAVVVLAAFLRSLNRIFAETIRWSEDITSKEEYSTQFNALLFHFLFIKTSSICALVLFA